jgi:hypothetical protein
MNIAKQVDQKIAEHLSLMTGALVEVTTTGEGKFTVSGKTNDAQVAAHWLYTHNIASVNDSATDEDGDSYFYMVQNGR